MCVGGLFHTGNICDQACQVFVTATELGMSSVCYSTQAVCGARCVKCFILHTGNSMGPGD